MKTSILIATAALAVSGAAVAEPVTRTTTYDGPKVDATRVAVRDKAAGTYISTPRRPAPAMAQRPHAPTIAHAPIPALPSAKALPGSSAIREAMPMSAAARTMVMSGTVIGRNSETYTLAGQGLRTDTGSTRSQSITNESGATFYDRNVVASRSDVQFNRNVSLTRAAGFRRRGFGSGRRQ
ncbi:MAG: hypothetical protein ACOYLK_01630 [Sphingomonas sp.]